MFVLASKPELKDNKGKTTGIDIYTKVIKIMIKEKSVENLESEWYQNLSSRADLC